MNPTGGISADEGMELTRTGHKEDLKLLACCVLSSHFSQDLLDHLSSSNPHLRGVWLQAKDLNDQNIQDLCNALILNKVVTEVRVPSNNITDVGALHIAHMLKFNRTIKELYLDENVIGPKGAAALASALGRNNNTLVALGLGQNHIGEGAFAFAAALQQNHTLHTLDIKDNGIPKNSSIHASLKKMLKSNEPRNKRLILGLQGEFSKLVESLPPDDAERVVEQANHALNDAMMCLKRGDKVGAAKAEGIFLRICTSGETPQDPPEDMKGNFQAVMRRDSIGRPRPKKQLEPDRLDGLNDELAELKFDREKDGDETIEEVAEAVSRGDEKGHGEEVTIGKDEYAAEDDTADEPPADDPAKRFDATLEEGTGRRSKAVEEETVDEV